MSDSAGERLFRRVMNAMGLARVTASDDSGATQRLQLDFGAGEVQDNRFRLSEWGFASRPLPGADAVVVFLGGDRSSGLVIATGDRRYRIHLEAGEVAIHDDLGHAVKLGRAGIHFNGGGHNITIDNAPQIIATGGDILADTVSLKNHVHTGVQPGAGLSGAPQQ